MALQKSQLKKDLKNKTIMGVRGYHRSRQLSMPVFGDIVLTGEPDATPVKTTTSSAELSSAEKRQLALERSSEERSSEESNTTKVLTFGGVSMLIKGSIDLKVKAEQLIEANVKLTEAQTAQALSKANLTDAETQKVNAKTRYIKIKMANHGKAAMGIVAKVKPLLVPIVLSAPIAFFGAVGAGYGKEFFASNATENATENVGKSVATENVTTENVGKSEATENVTAENVGKSTGLLSWILGSNSVETKAETSSKANFRQRSQSFDETTSDKAETSSKTKFRQRSQSFDETTSDKVETSSKTNVRQPQSFDETTSDKVETSSKTNVRQRSIGEALRTFSY